MNAKASLTGEMVIWLAIVLAVVIAIAWFLANFFTQKPAFQTIENDIAKISSMLNDSCNLYSYSYSYNPSVEKGRLKIIGSKVCINSEGLERCRELGCDTGLAKNIDLSTIKDILVEKPEGGSINVSGK